LSRNRRPLWPKRLGVLDAFTRMRMQDELLHLSQARRTTMLLVTHEIDEAIYMSDRIVIMTRRPGAD
jgi:ABC-type nitrate/sulfonate/bicarbonate transport system ATPase subunit